MSLAPPSIGAVGPRSPARSSRLASRPPAAAGARRCLLHEYRDGHVAWCEHHPVQHVRASAHANSASRQRPGRRAERALEAWQRSASACGRQSGSETQRFECITHSGSLFGRQIGVSRKRSAATSWTSPRCGACAWAATVGPALPRIRVVRTGRGGQLVPDLFRDTFTLDNPSGGWGDTPCSARNRRPLRDGLAGRLIAVIRHVVCTAVAAVDQYFGADRRRRRSVSLPHNSAGQLRASRTAAASWVAAGDDAVPVGAKTPHCSPHAGTASTVLRAARASMMWSTTRRLTSIPRWPTPSTFMVSTWELVWHRSQARHDDVECGRVNASHRTSSGAGAQASRCNRGEPSRTLGHPLNGNRFAQASLEGAIRGDHSKPVRWRRPSAMVMPSDDPAKAVSDQMHLVRTRFEPRS